MRRLEQPGMPDSVREYAVDCNTRTIRSPLRPGQDIAAALFEAAASAGFASGAFALENLPVADLTYNLPSLYDGSDKAAWFAGPFSGDRAVIESGRVTIGLKDGAPMFHCHAAWRTPDGALSGGHLLLDRMSLPAPAAVTFHGVTGAVFDVLPDSETNFSIFKPVPQERDRSADDTDMQPALLARVAPNLDLAESLCGLIAAHGWRSAEILSGVGSFVGGAFADGLSVPDPITEALVTGGNISANMPDTARIEAIATDPLGIVRWGRLKPRENAVGITFEVLLGCR